MIVFENWAWTVARPDCSPLSTTVTATVELDDDISELIPYVNSLVERGVFYPDIPYIRFQWAGRTIILHPRLIQITSLADRQEAREVLASVFDYLRDIDRRRKELQPNYQGQRQVRVLDVFRLLPRKNCGRCGVPACMAFAAMVSRREAGPCDCPPLLEPGNESNRAQLEELLS